LAVNKPIAVALLVSKIQRATAPKAAVPLRGEKPIHGLVSDKNFIVANAVENILAGKFRILALFQAILPILAVTYVQKKFEFLCH